MDPMLVALLASQLLARTVFQEPARPVSSQEPAATRGEARPSVLFWLWAPGRLPAGLRLREPVRSVDIYPTLLELLGVTPPQDLAGESLVPWIRAGKATQSRTVFADNIEERTSEQFGGGQHSTGSNGESFAVIRWPWKLILHRKARLGLTLPRHELFHLECDPAEKKNEAAAEPELVKELEDLILAHVDEGGAAELPLPPEAELDPEARKALEGLGYLGDDEDD